MTAAELTARAERYLDLVQALPGEVQAVLGLGLSLALYGAWRVTTPVRAVLGAGLRFAWHLGTGTRALRRQLAALEKRIAASGDLKGWQQALTEAGAPTRAEFDDLRERFQHAEDMREVDAKTSSHALHEVLERLRRVEEQGAARGVHVPFPHRAEYGAAASWAAGGGPTRLTTNARCLSAKDLDRAIRNVQPDPDPEPSAQRLTEEEKARIDQMRRAVAFNRPLSSLAAGFSAEDLRKGIADVTRKLRGDA